MTPDKQAELARLENCGFHIESHTRGFRIVSTPEAIRTSQLYRTIPHEIGHYMHYLHCWENFEWGEDHERFWQLYGSISPREKEVVAHRYADDFCNKMRNANNIPFDSKFDNTLIRKDNLKPDWFHESGNKFEQYLTTYNIVRQQGSNNRQALYS